ncbi:MAG: hypothetical protein FWB71_03795 [Defluviitaleaceae bacterium]|nr:hypothetical protein [Defluviitaleaceae bacterium]
MQTKPLWGYNKKDGRQAMVYSPEIMSTYLAKCEQHGWEGFRAYGDSVAAGLRAFPGCDWRDLGVVVQMDGDEYSKKQRASHVYQT